MLLQWVMVVCGRVAGWERVKPDVPWLSAPAGHSYAVIWERVLSHRESVCVSESSFVQHLPSVQQV